MTPKQLLRFGIILVVLAALWALLPRLTRKKPPRTLLSPEDRSKVSRVIFRSLGQEIEILQEESGWRMLRPWSYAADGVEIQELLGRLTQSEYRTLITEKQEKYPLFEVTPSSGIRLQLYTSLQPKSQPVLDILFGKGGSDTDSLFARPSESSRVYEVSGLERRLLERKPQELLYSVLFSISKADIRKIEIQRAQEKLLFQRKQEAWSLNGVALSSQTVSSQLEPVLTALVTLQADQMIPPEEASAIQKNLKKPVLQIAVAGAQKMESLRVAGPEDSGQHLVQKEGAPFLFQLNSWKLEPFQKKKKDYL